MTFVDDLIKKDELEIGKSYKKQLLNHYADDYNCALVILDSPVNIIGYGQTGEYEVEQIIDDCRVELPARIRSTSFSCEKIIVIKQVS